MEAPEKIYMTPSFGEPDNVLLASFSKSHLDYHRDIEYTRTDAFIEKAEKWLNEHILDYVYAEEWGQGVGVEGEFFNDFKKYMKGE